LKRVPNLIYEKIQDYVVSYFPIHLNFYGQTKAYAKCLTMYRLAGWGESSTRKRSNTKVVVVTSAQHRPQLDERGRACRPRERTVPLYKHHSDAGVRQSVKMVTLVPSA